MPFPLLLLKKKSNRSQLGTTLSLPCSSLSFWAHLRVFRVCIWSQGCSLWNISYGQAGKCTSGFASSREKELAPALGAV